MTRDIGGSRRRKLWPSAFLSLAALALVPAAARATNWSIQPTPTVQAPAGEFLLGISCPSVSRCYSEGGFTEERPPGPLEAVWNGATWSVSGGGGKPDEGNLFVGNACPGVTVCVAVRYDQHKGPVEPTAVSYGSHAIGGGISSVPYNGDVPYDKLLAVSCSAPNACTAVGADVGTDQPFVVRWDGQVWTIQDTPLLPEGGQLVAVSCYPSSCVAVGTRYGGDGQLVETWDGSHWSVTPMPDLGPNAAALAGVSCPRVNHCTAVGSRANAAGMDVPLVEQQVSGVWKAQSVPDPAGTIASGFTAVKCRADSGCTAVGSSRESDDADVTLIEHQLYVRWNIQPSPDPPGATSSSLSGVACPAAGVCFAVGQSVDETANAPTENVLVERSSPG